MADFSIPDRASLRTRRRKYLCQLLLFGGLLIVLIALFVVTLLLPTTSENSLRFVLTFVLGFCICCVLIFGGFAVCKLEENRKLLDQLRISVGVSSSIICVETQVRKWNRERIEFSVGDRIYKIRNMKKSSKRNDE